MVVAMKSEIDLSETAMPESEFKGARLAKPNLTSNGKTKVLRCLERQCQSQITIGQSRDCLSGDTSRVAQGNTTVEGRTGQNHSGQTRFFVHDNCLCPWPIGTVRVFCRRKPNGNSIMWGITPLCCFVWPYVQLWDWLPAAKDCKRRYVTNTCLFEL